MLSKCAFIRFLAIERLDPLSQRKGHKRRMFHSPKMGQSFFVQSQALIR